MSEDSVVAHVGGNPVAELKRYIPPEALRVFIELLRGHWIYSVFVAGRLRHSRNRSCRNHKTVYRLY